MMMNGFTFAVYADGTLCMDIIQDAWSPCHNVSTILTSIQVPSYFEVNTLMNFAPFKSIRQAC